MKDHFIATLYKNLAPELLLTAFYYVKNEEDAKDVVADVFERVLKMTNLELQDLSSNEKSKGYLFVMVKYKCFDLLKVQKNRLVILEKEVFKQQHATQSSHDYEVDVFKKMILELPKREAEVLKLNIEGFKHAEIAETMGISYLTVRNALHEAKKKSRVLWDNYFN